MSRCCQVVGSSYWMNCSETVPTLPGLGCAYAQQLCCYSTNPTWPACLPGEICPAETACGKDTSFCLVLHVSFDQARRLFVLSSHSFFNAMFSAIHRLRHRLPQLQQCQQPSQRPDLFWVPQLANGSYVLYLVSLELFSTGRSRSHHLPSPWFLGFSFLPIEWGYEYLACPTFEQTSTHIYIVSRVAWEISL